MEINSEIHHQEFFAIADCFEHWCHFMEGSPHQIIVYNDHKNLTYYQSTRVFNCRQTRWVELLMCFDFLIVYHPKIHHEKVDALCQLFDFASCLGEPAFDHPKKIPLGPDLLRRPQIRMRCVDSYLSRS